MELLQREKGLDAYNDVLSRQIKVPHTSPVPTVLRILQSNQLSEWTLTINEIDGLADVKLEITLKQQNTEYTYHQPLNRGGGYSIQGWGAITVTAEAINNATAKLNVSLQPETSVRPPVYNQGSTTFSILAIAGVEYEIPNTTDLTPAGYPPPFCTFLDIHVGNPCQLIARDITGTQVWFDPAMAPESLYWRDIRIFPWFKYTLSTALGGTRFTNLWHN